MHVLVCGSRDWPSEQQLHDHLDETHRIHPITLLIEGGARGADRFAQHWAFERGIDVKTMPADWDRHGKSAGFKRNMAMLDERPHLVIAFTTGSRGTQHTIDGAKARRIPLEVITPC